MQPSSEIGERFEPLVPQMLCYAVLSQLNILASVGTAAYVCAVFGVWAGILLFGGLLIARKVTSMLIAAASGGLRSDAELAHDPNTLVAWTRRVVVAEWALVIGACVVIAGQ